MKHLIISLIIFISFLTSVKAESKDIYLENLMINNGSLSIPFDKYNNTYSVYLNNSVDELDISYDLKDEYSSIIIYNNYDLLTYNKQVVIRVINEEGTKDNKYYLNVYKENHQEVSYHEEEMLPLEIPIKKKYHLESIISSICFLIILTIYSILFKKSSNKIN